VRKDGKKMQCPEQDNRIARGGQHPPSDERLTNSKG
jgi:hypothetical protein